MTTPNNDVVGVCPMNHPYQQPLGKTGRIGYIRKEIPDFEVPEYQGERYRALVPDTLDLQDMAAWGVNGLTSSTNPNADYEAYWGAHFGSNPLRMGNGFDGGFCQVKYLESLPLLRIASGSTQNQMVDRRWMEMLLRMQGEDGLLYTPVKGRPWWGTGMASIYIPSPYYEKLASGEWHHYLNPIWARSLAAIMLHQHRDVGTLWAETARRYVDGLTALAVDRGRYAFFAPSPMFAEKGCRELADNIELPEALKKIMQPTDGKKGGVDTFVFTSPLFMVPALSHVYREIGYEPALTLAGKIVNYLVDELRLVDEEGHPLLYLRDKRSAGGMAHFHTATYALLAILHYAIDAGDQRLLEIVRKGYEYLKTFGETLTGFFPEHIGLGCKEMEHSEMCEVADMIQLALIMTRHGLGDYWDDADRWIRNMLIEGQLTPDKADRLKQYSAGKPFIPRTAPAAVKKDNAREGEDAPFDPMTIQTSSDTDPMGVTEDRVADRLVGTFCGQPGMNDWDDGNGPGACCTGNGTRAIYYAWKSILTHDAGRLRINLLLNRASAWADVNSHIPYKGQVDVRIKQAVTLSMRIAEWVKPEEASVEVDGQAHDISWDGRYAVVGDVKPGAVVTMRFPIAERTENVWIEKRHYTLTIKGNNVVAIDPRGAICPLYDHTHYRLNRTRWKETLRFAPADEIAW